MTPRDALTVRAEAERLLTKAVLNAAWHAMVEQPPDNESEYRRVASVILAALAPLFDRLEAAPTWQPIATAPKDGTKILVTDGVSVQPTEWLRNSAHFAGYYVNTPKAWMPFPPPLAPSAEPPTED